MSRAVPRFKRTNPPLPLVGTTNGIVMYRIVGTIEGQLTINTFYYSAAVPAPTQAQLTTLLTNIDTAMFASYHAALSSDWACTKETIDVVHRNDIVGVQLLTNAGVNGSRAAGHEPTQVAAVILRKSAVKGQHGRGRVSLPAIATADVVASKITAAAEITALNAVATAMASTATDGANTWTPCIVQRATTPPRLVIGFSAQTQVAAQTLLGTVRRRKIGRGK